MVQCPCLCHYLRQWFPAFLDEMRVVYVPSIQWPSMPFWLRAGCLGGPARGRPRTHPSTDRCAVPEHARMDCEMAVRRILSGRVGPTVVGAGEGARRTAAGTIGQTAHEKDPRAVWWRVRRAALRTVSPATRRGICERVLLTAGTAACRAVRQYPLRIAHPTAHRAAVRAVLQTVLWIPEGAVSGTASRAGRRAACRIIWGTG
jgi:hypothetical protein